MRCQVCQTDNNDRLYCVHCGHQMRAAPKTDPLLGHLLDGRFRIKTKLGEGRSSSVYEAFELPAHRDVALRIIHPEPLTSPELTAQFHAGRERHLALRDAHIIPAYAMGEAEGLLFIASELVCAPRLHQILYDAGALAWDRALEIVGQLCCALRAAHAGGLAGPVSPEKVYLESKVRPDPAEDGRLGGPYREAASVIIEHARVDFGPRSVASLDANHAIQGQNLGPYEYMSPEQLFEKPRDARSEVFSLGVLAYEMITGELPFTPDRNPTARVLAQRGKRAAPPSAVGESTLPPELDHIILRCLEPDPADRHADVSALRDALLAARMIS